MGMRKAKKQAMGCVTLVIVGGVLVAVGLLVVAVGKAFEFLSRPGVMETIFWWVLGLMLAGGAIFGLVKWLQSGSKQRGSGDVTKFRSEIRGIFAGSRREACGELRIDDTLVPVRDRSNPEDVNAILLLSKGGHELGYLPREQVDEIAPVVDSGGRFLVRVMQIGHASTGSVSDVILLCELEGEHRVSPLRTKRERKQYAEA